jgi:hypothetical protein
MKRSWLLGLIIGAWAVQAAAQSQCTVTLKFDNERFNYRYRVFWDPVPKADTYVLEETRDNFRTTLRTEIVNAATAAELSRTITYQSTVDVNTKFRLTASSSTGQIVPCSATRDLRFAADSAYQRLVRRSTIPMVGSVVGAYGSLFKTSLRLRATRDNQRGKLILRRQSIPASEADPTIPYAFAGKGDVLNFDDVVAAFGVSGLGSIDIVPEATETSGLAVPFAEVRLFNVTPQGTFGTIESQTQPASWDDSAAHSLTFIVPGPDLRLNFGVRTFSDAFISVTARRNGTTVASNLLKPSTEIFLFGTARDMLGGADLLPGDEIVLSGIGTWVPMYTITDNRTNDPALYVPPTRVELDVETFTTRR